MRRLTLKLPTALQVESSYAILFHEGGVSELTDLGNPFHSTITFSRKHSSKRVWALVDSDLDTLNPPSIFMHFSPFFVVSSAPNPYKPWLLGARYENFYMKPWSDLEVIAGYVDIVARIL